MAPLIVPGLFTMGFPTIAMVVSGLVLGSLFLKVLAWVVDKYGLGKGSQSGLGMTLILGMGIIFGFYIPVNMLNIGYFLSYRLRFFYERRVVSFYFFF